MLLVLSLDPLHFKFLYSKIRPINTKLPKCFLIANVITWTKSTDFDIRFEKKWVVGKPAIHLIVVQTMIFIWNSQEICFIASRLKNCCISWLFRLQKAHNALKGFFCPSSISPIHPSLEDPPSRTLQLMAVSNSPSSQEQTLISRLPSYFCTGKTGTHNSLTFISTARSRIRFATISPAFNQHWNITGPHISSINRLNLFTFCIQTFALPHTFYHRGSRP